MTTQAHTVATVVGGKVQGKPARVKGGPDEQNCGETEARANMTLSDDWVKVHRPRYRSYLMTGQSSLINLTRLVTGIAGASEKIVVTLEFSCRLVIPPKNG